MMDKTLLKLANEVVEVIDKSLVSLEPPPKENDSAFLAILLRDLTTFKVILKLLSFKNTGNACMVLARTTVESMIGVEFMKLLGLDKMLKRFRLFEYAEAKEDIDFLRKKGLDVSSLNPEEIERRFKKNKKLFERKPGEIWKSWAHTDFEGMVKKLLKEGRISLKELETLLSTYLQGSRKIHLSPSDTKFYILGEAILKEKNKRDSRLALVASMSSLLRVATIFAERTKNPSLAEKLNRIFQELDKNL